MSRSDTPGWNHREVQGHHLLAKQRPGPHYAEVRVSVESLTQRTVYISPNAFSWLRQEYGDSAQEGPGLDRFKQEALDGATFALTEAGVGGEVAVTEIRFLTADTANGDVRFTAAFAVWEALGYQPSDPPWIDDTGVHFPDR